MNAFTMLNRIAWNYILYKSSHFALTCGKWSDKSVPVIVMPDLYCAMFQMNVVELFTRLEFALTLGKTRPKELHVCDLGIWRMICVKQTLVLWLWPERMSMFPDFTQKPEADQGFHRRRRALTDYLVVSPCDSVNTRKSSQLGKYGIRWLHFLTWACYHNKNAFQ